MEPPCPQEDSVGTVINKESYQGLETEKRVAKTDEDNELGDEKVQGKVMKLPFFRIKADSFGIKTQDVQRTSRRSRGQQPLKTGEMAKAMANRIKKGAK
jgi:hypothetical protein